VAFTKAPGGKPTAFYYAVLLDGLFGVVAAAGVKATVVPQPRAD